MSALTCPTGGCAGTVASDGYCNTCGSKGVAGAPAGAPAAPQQHAHSHAHQHQQPAPQQAAPQSSVAGGNYCPTFGCKGQISTDGYCNTCGSRGVASRPTATPGASQVGAAVPPSGACSVAGCKGHIASDGYCDTCGAAAAAPSTGAGGGGSRLSTIAAPVSPGASTRASGSVRSSASRRTTSSRRTTRAGIGAGLVTIVPTPMGDPSKAVMTPEKVQSVLGAVPEDERHCAKCGKPVGRSSGDKPGRVEGFCGTCREQFNFITNAPALRAGEMVNGQYEILGPLAHGGLGWIYLGRDKSVSDRWVVLKGMLNANDPDAAAAAAAERQFLAQIEHPSIVNIYNFVTHGGAGYIVMEYVGGESLNSKLKDRRRANGGKPDPLPITEAIAYILGVLPAFQYLHDSGLVYNDMKPANIMAVGDNVKLIDLGAVMRIDDMQAAIFGTEGFQAPEVATEGPSVASDLYTIGRTLAVMTIEFIFHAGRYKESLPTPVEEPLFADWESYYRFLLKATAPHPDDRFQSADEMAEQLLGVLQEIVALTRGTPVAAASTHFGADRLTSLLAEAGDTGFLATEADWRVLPSLKVDPEDPSSNFLANLPDLEPDRILELIDVAASGGQIQNSREVQLRRARALIEGAGSGARATVAEPILTGIENEDPWEWRVQWLRGLGLLLDGKWVEAADRFSAVWTDLPGERGPKLAVALAAERAGEFDRAAEIYGRVLATDQTYVSAAFGLARCRYARGDRPGAVDAYQRIPASSATYYDAQVAATRTLVDSGSQTPPTVEELSLAAQTVEKIQLDAAERAELATEILERGLTALESGALPPDGRVRLFKSSLDEESIREGLERSYRDMARYTPDPKRKIELIDKANRVRPMTML